jgi:hypothetical protein
MTIPTNLDFAARWLESLGHAIGAGPFAADLWDSQADYYPVRKFPEARPCHGREEILSFQKGYTEAWDIQYQAKRVIPIADDRLFAEVRIKASGLGSGVDLDGDLFHCFWIRHGRAFRVEDHLTLAGALTALGVTEDVIEANASQGWGPEGRPLI